jgi:hypothetical protein
MRRIAFALSAAALAATTVTACGSNSNSGVGPPQIGAAKQFALGRFKPAGRVRPDRPVTISFDVRMPDGKPLTRYKTGAGPHTGVHLILVRDDLAYIIHTHPPIGPNGRLRQTVTFPAPGPYRVLVDIYPNLKDTLPNFQLFTKIDVTGAYHATKPPPFNADQKVDGYHFDMTGHPALHAIQAAFLHINVTDSHGKPVRFTPWFGALAHAIFFREGSLDYFHTHICAAKAPNCGTLPGVAATTITGSSSAPGKLTAGVLLARPGTWRLFLQMKLHGKIVTAPFTLQVSG